MGLGVSFKVAPGIRIRASSRGLRTSIGPRGARLHVGGGRITVSSGVGPLTVWEPVGRTRRHASAARSRPAASTPRTPSLAMLQRQADVASAQAATDAGHAWQQALRAQADQQRQADADWADLESGKPDYATVVVVFGTPDLVPDRKPAPTPGGKPTPHKRTKTEPNTLYAAALGSTVLATVKEGFAVAPSVQEIMLLVARVDPAPPTPDLYLTAIYAARFPRAATMALPWATLDPAETLLRAPGAQLVRRGSADEIVPLDLRDEPELAALVAELRPHL